MSETPLTRTAPARPPDGFWVWHPRYRSYVLFAGTGLLLAIAAALVVRAVRVLGEGAAAWQAYLEGLAGPAAALNALVFVGVVWFALRFLRVGIKALSVPIGPLPALPQPLLWAVQVGGLVVMNLLIALIMFGVIL